MFRELVLLTAACLAPMHAHAEDAVAEFSGRIVAKAGFDLGRHESTDVIASLAGGVDYNINEEAFVGVEASVAHAFNAGHHHWLHDDEGRTTGALLARGGLVIATRTKAYALFGVRISSEEQPSVYGIGIERKIGRLLGSLEYQRANSYRSDQILLGLGVQF